jgi:hypothetical protein
MSLESAAVWLVRLLGVYAGIGLVVAVPFVLRGVERVDAAARGATAGFRLIVLPAAVALWPLVARRWWRGTGSPPTERNAHRSAAAGGTPP